ncbi:MAG: FprA family A-type flavoprotein [Clostridia bacterium]|nr:FprA family A-type flavoprotein [Clostridia bacterium]
MNITDNVRYVGVNDYDIDLFEGMYVVPNGMAYNSYVVLDEKIAVMDTVDKRFQKAWLDNVESVLQGKEPDYLIVQHMEPDHSANISAFAKRYPSAIIVATRQAFVMMQNYFGTDYAEKRLVVGDGDTLSLGGRTLSFVTAPMVHWPEVMMTFDDKDKILFSADAFGKFGTTDTDEEWACEARRYYFGIVGKYGVQVRNVLQKIANLGVKTICPLHGVVLQENVQDYMSLYQTWSGYEAEDEGVFIAYTSVYGNTKKAVELLELALKKRGVKTVVCDLARNDRAEAVEDAFRYSKTVFATTTYNGEIFPFMREFIYDLCERNFQNKTVGFIENGSWAPMAGRVMRERLDKCKNLQFVEPVVTIFSAVKDENVQQIEALADALS